MSTSALEERVTLLETEVLHLKQLLKKTASVPWWEQIHGVFADTPAFDEAVRLGRNYRAAQQPPVTKSEDEDVST